ncbi:hypothetical protein EJ08DRAFT_611272 [Tothia fuscella]|uniref:ORC6 first cyclin-like domain-containing protein n=1 Tax=Tothia fuscella TaxID=1048955 RepID=A0A9P4TYU5_9PEZI|nr:hypothetical protein EJ08DRAFT_611272 [Tothia fuscella]
MSKAVEFDLLSLLPGVTLPVPPKLVNLGVSLLAQSRSKAANLKGEEEIARGYVCAHIACERLKQSLDLPKIVPRPSIPPRAYKKLYEYLDSVLTVRPARQVESAPTTPSKPRPATGRNPTTPSNKAAPNKATPGKATPNRATPSKNRTPQAPSVKKRKLDTGGKDDLPGWITPAIRAVCKALKKPMMTPHVFVGVSSLLPMLQSESSTSNSLTPRKRARKSTDASSAITEGIPFDDDSIPSLIAMVAIHAINALSPAAPTAAEYRALRMTCTSTLAQCMPDDMVVTEEEMIKGIERFLRAADSRSWLEMEWYENLVSQAQADELDGNDGAADDDETGRNGRAEKGKSGKERARRIEDGASVQRRAFGGMMTPQTDYCSEENLAGYKEWRKYIEGLMR